MGLRFVLLLSLLVGLPMRAAAEGERTSVARDVFDKGKLAYERHDFEAAYENFKQAYLISQQPEMLYNISSALEGLGRAREAAEALRTFLQRRPNDADRAAIEKHIQELEATQRDLDTLSKPGANTTPETSTLQNATQNAPEKATENAAA